MIVNLPADSTRYVHYGQMPARCTFAPCTSRERGSTDVVRWRLAEVLRERRITTYRLIQIAGIHRTQAYRLVRGTPVRRIDTTLLNKLCAALDVQPGDLLEYVPGSRSRPLRSRRV